MSLAPSDITPGLVLRLDTTALRTLGGCETNAEQGAAADRAVTGTHDFLVVGVDRSTDVCTAVPLFPKAAVGNQPLEESHKRGHAPGWIGSATYFSRWQHWRIPVASIIAVAHEDAVTSPRHYALGDGPMLDDIRVWESRNRAPYRSA